MMHHSRDTAHKQWAETQVLSLTGVARCGVVCVVLCVHVYVRACVCSVLTLGPMGSHQLITDDLMREQGLKLHMREMSKCDAGIFLYWGKPERAPL